MGANPCQNSCICTAQEDEYEILQIDWATDSRASVTDPSFVGQMIAKLRYKRGWTQDQLAIKMQLKGCDVSRHVVANIESGRSKPTYEQIKSFSHVFKVPVSTFFPADVKEIER